MFAPFLLYNRVKVVSTSRCLEDSVSMRVGEKDLGQRTGTAVWVLSQL